jgi:predicted TIM-barrel fold metal-dependent hydrolase
MIDTHIHVCATGLPGEAALSPLLDLDPPSVAAELLTQMQAAGIRQAMAMGHLPSHEDDPLGIASTRAVARALAPSGHVLHAVGIADPTRDDPEHFRRVEKDLAAGRVKALKAYLGYVHRPPDDPGYLPYYELAGRYRIPVVFHTGDTFSPRAKLRFAHPLLVDDVAVDHPHVSFILAHLGNPWLTDAAEVIYKNVNVWADLSGLAVGDEESFAADERRELLHEAREALRRAFRYAERPNRFLHGSDWPLAPMPAYREWVASAIPEIHHPQVFEDNARLLFKL